MGKKFIIKCDGSNFSIYDKFIKEQYQEYRIKIEENHIAWEYTNEKLKLKSMTNYMIIILILIFDTSISLAGIFLISYYKKC